MTSTVQHISMRVPWRDQPWDDKVCTHPADNSSCLLLKNIGDSRDDAWEESVAGSSFADLADFERLPCLSERGTFMSAAGYQVQKEHPYRFNRVLQGHLLPTEVSVPAYSFEAIPFRWLSRANVDDELWQATDSYHPEREDAAHAVLGFKPGWLMDGRNQRAMLERFFDDVVPNESLVLVYLKHSPLQEQSTRRLLIGAAMVTSLALPPMWNQSGAQPFDSSMWETIVTHSLRPSQHEGVLLPYQALMPLLDSGVDVEAALAWAPEDATVDFSYVTEHVSDDTAIAALNSLRAAADGMSALGVTIPASAVAWIDAQIERLWHLRGPAPGMAAVLSYLGVESTHRVVRRLAAEADWPMAPWATAERAFTVDEALALALSEHLPPSVGYTWRGLAESERRALQILSAMDLRYDQVDQIMRGKSTYPIAADELVANPYYAATCTYRSEFPVALTTVDQACFPATHVTWVNLVDGLAGMKDPGDERRVEALLVDVLERRAAAGDTLADEAQVLTEAAEMHLTRPCAVSKALVTAYGLDAQSLDSRSIWSPLVGAVLADGAPAYQLAYLRDVGDMITAQLKPRRDAKRFEIPFDPRSSIDAAFGPIEPGDAAGRSASAGTDRQGPRADADEGRPPSTDTCELLGQEGWIRPAHWPLLQRRSVQA